jgi:hypothetical protein
VAWFQTFEGHSVRILRMPDAIALAALWVALIAVILGVAIHGREFWLAFNEKPHPSVDGAIGSADAGPSWSGDAGGGDGGSA